MTGQSTQRRVTHISVAFTSAMLVVLVTLAMLQSAQSTGTCQTPHLSLTGERFVTITEGEELTLTCSMASPTPNVDTYWYLQFQNITDPLDTATVPYHYPELKFQKQQEGQVFNVTVQGLSARLGHVMVQCTARAIGESERFSKGMFMVHIVAPDSGRGVEPNHTPVECCQTSCINKSFTEAFLQQENIGNCSSVQDQVLQLTILTMVVSTCLIVNTITLLMVVIVLCTLRKREPLTHNNSDKTSGQNGGKETNDGQ